MEDNINNQRVLRDFAITTTHDGYSSVVRPAVVVNNFEIKPSIVQMGQQNQFRGLENEDPHVHLSRFSQICDTFKMNGVSEDAIKLRLFPFSLKDRATSWLDSRAPGAFTTWQALFKAFLAKYFPSGKTAKLRNKIATFFQRDDESLYEAWERFKDLQRQCPHHGLTDWLVVQTFSNGLSHLLKSILDAAANGSLMGKTFDMALHLIEEMASNSCRWPNDRASQKRHLGVHEVDGITMVNAKLDALTKKLERLDIKVVRTSSCENCGGDHTSFVCQMGTHYAHEPTNEQGDAQDEAIRQLTTKVDQLATHNKMLEVQLGQQASTSNSREIGKLSSQPQNLREHCKAIVTRSGKQLGEPISKVENELDEQKDIEKSSEEDTLEKKVEGNIQEALEKQVPSKTYSTPLPFPHRFQKAKLDQQFGKFLDVFKQIHLNVPFMEAITQMSTYAKFLKDILSNKMKLEEFEMVALLKECSAILQNKLPQKFKDPGRFSILCVVGKESFEKALCDLGASISLMPLSICRRLELGELKPTTVTLQLADRSIKYPIEIMENVPIKVGKFYIPVDFVVLEMEKNIQVPLILGRPFLAIAGAIIDIKNGKLTFEIGDEKVEFNVFQMSKQPNIVNSCCRVDIIDDCVKEVFIKKYPEDPLESCIIHGASVKDENMEITVYAQLMEVNPKVAPILNFKYEELETGNHSLLSLKTEDAPKVDSKPLPANLRYAFLGPNSTYLVIINVELNDEQEDKLFRELRAYRKIIG
ncbi:uncharacterized protein LOC123213766 [Mangifera indica]|uniref:uncharacterized protein LOC123213766 n=1 Tax=Mangifera indica TaxID=29780 RepID=UPI001CFC297D|nr:uncharacterized protein LOC123213766 [Mangifera indica]